MYEYKVLNVSVKKAETALNQCAKEGWRLVNALPNAGICAGLVGMVYTLERKAGEDLAG